MIYLCGYRWCVVGVNNQLSSVTGFQMPTHNCFDEMLNEPTQEIQSRLPFCDCQVMDGCYTAHNRIIVPNSAKNTLTLHAD